MVTLNNEQIKYVSFRISNSIYEGKIEETKQLIELINNISRIKIEKLDGYIEFYDNSLYTYPTFEELVKSELEISDGLSKDECEQEIGKTIWKLDCGWYVQYV